MLALALMGCFGSGPWDGSWLLRMEPPATFGGDCEPDDDDPVRTGDEPSILDIYSTGDGDITAMYSGLIFKGWQDGKTMSLEYREEDDNDVFDIEINALIESRVLRGSVAQDYEAFDPAYKCTAELDFTGSKVNDSKNHLD